MPCRLVGVLIMEDEAGMDEKLIAVPTSKIDPRFDNIKDIKDLPQSTLAKIKNFFETYKTLEAGKWVKVQDFKGLDEASNLLNSFIEKAKK